MQLSKWLPWQRAFRLQLNTRRQGRPGTVPPVGTRSISSIPKPLAVNFHQNFIQTREKLIFQKKKLIVF